MNVQAGRLPNQLACPASPALVLKRQRLILKLSLVVTDVLAVGLALNIAYLLRFKFGFTVSPDFFPDPDFYPNLTLLMIPVWVLILMLFRLYELQGILGGVAEYSKILNASTTATMVVVIATFLVREFDVSRSWLISAWLLTFLFVTINRFLLRRVVYGLRRKGFLLAPAVIVGTNQEASTLGAHLADWRMSGLRVLGYLSTGQGNGVKTEMDLPVLGNIREVGRIAQNHDVEDLVVAITALEREQLLDLCEQANEIPNLNLRLSSGLYELLTTSVSVRTLGTVPLISFNKLRLDPGQLYLKAVLECAVTFFALLLLSPVFPLIALLIKLDSPGPVFFRRRVLGLSGKPFDAFKFRTMHLNGDEALKDRPELVRELKTNHKLKDDPRVTRVGRFLRKYSLDELPQLFNVFFGQMCLVGPRPITAEEVDKYGREKLNLFTVKPGMTGLWQVSGRSDLSYEERVRLDMYYVCHYSVWLDLQILMVQTVHAVLRGRGAY
jgi:exopolysaccharide biosynthesis polyprenyl glycosylphosphotransferase